MKNIFTRSLAAAPAAGIKLRTKDSLEWFRTHVAKKVKKKVGRTDVENALSGEPVKTTTFRLGKMYLFAYDAKHKETLPYWDASPLIIPFSDDGKSITAINFHYLPPLLRAKLMDMLYGFITNERMDKTTKLKLTYQALKSSSRFQYVKPCVKKYLKTHIRSELIEIPPSYWEAALFLPVASWQKQKHTVVYKDSTRIANGNSGNGVQRKRTSKSKL